MVTEHKHEIVKLELELASKEKPCPECYDFEAPPIRLPDGTLQASDCTAKDCNGTSFVPLIEGSRRDCPLCLNGGNEEWNKYCKECEGLGWVPNVDGMKVLTWLLSFGFSYVRLASDELFPGKIKALFILNARDILIEGTNPYEILLRAALARIATMNAEEDRDH